MSTKLPIAMALKRWFAKTDGDMIMTKLPDGQEICAPAMTVGFKSAVFFDVQVANDIFMSQWETQRFPASYSANQPFPYTWMEWREDLLKKNVACLIEEPDPLLHNGPINANILYTLVWTLADDSNRPKIFPIEATIDTEDDGTVKLVTYHALGDVEYDDRDDLEKILHLYLYTAFTALGLINCNNVTTREAGRIQLGRTGTQKRRGEPAAEIRYRTIILPGGGSESDGKGGHRATALHRVRGHFKTFTPERPLLGQHVGTYWWGWQVRGKSENGTVISDYKVKAS